MKRIFLRLKQPLRNERGEITFFACFFVVGIVMLISFLLLYASIRITCINIRNGAKMELNNLKGTVVLVDAQQDTVIITHLIGCKGITACGTACQQVALTPLIQFLFHCHQWQGR